MLQSTVQELLRRDFPKHVLASFDAGTESVGSRWEALASTGLLGSLVPEEYGGVGGTLADAAVVFEELGKGPVPGPHFSSGVLAALLVSECGSSEQKTAHLPAIVDGSRSLCRRHHRGTLRVGASARSGNGHAQRERIHARRGQAARARRRRRNPLPRCGTNEPGGSGVLHRGG